MYYKMLLNRTHINKITCVARTRDVPPVKCSASVCENALSRAKCVARKNQRRCGLTALRYYNIRYVPRYIQVGITSTLYYYYTYNADCLDMIIYCPRAPDDELTSCTIYWLYRIVVFFRIHDNNVYYNWHVNIVFTFSFFVMRGTKYLFATVTRQLLCDVRKKKTKNRLLRVVYSCII